MFTFRLKKTLLKSKKVILGTHEFHFERANSTAAAERAQKHRFRFAVTNVSPASQLLVYYFCPTQLIMHNGLLS